MADAFTRNRLNWIERIATDGVLSANAVRLGVILATKYLNRRTGDCWPAIATLAELMAVDEKTIRRATSHLVTAGHLTCRRGGKGKTNRYRLAFLERAKMSDQEEVSPDKNAQSKESMTGHSCPDDRTILSETGGQNCPPNPLNEPSENPEGETRTSERAAFAALDVAFEELCKAYPSNHGGDIEVARNNFSTAIANGDTLDAIVDGARRYAASGNAPLYLAVWLKQLGWRKDWQPAPAKPRRNYRNDRDPLAAARRMMGGDE